MSALGVATQLRMSSISWRRRRAKCRDGSSSRICDSKTNTACLVSLFIEHMAK